LRPYGNIGALEEYPQDFPEIWEVPEVNEASTVVIEDWPVIVEVPLDGGFQ
jgi:hypothetical protein